MKTITKIIFLSFLTGYIFTQGHITYDPDLIFFIDSVTSNDSLPANNDSAEIKFKQIAEGKFLYDKKCGKCHILHDPGEYTAKEWKKILKVMKEKAELKKSEHNLILGYLIDTSLK